MIALMVRLARSGKQVVRLKGGDPTVLGRGGEELLALASAGIPFENVPGVTCAVAAPLLAGIPVTHRGLADSFTVVTAHRRGDEQRFSIPPFNPRTTLILLMGVGTVEQWRDQLRAEGYPADLPVAFVTDASTRSQQVLVTTLEWADDQARAHTIRPPTTVIVGKVVSLRSVIASQVPEGKTAAVALEEMLDNSYSQSSQSTRDEARTGDEGRISPFGSTPPAIHESPRSTHSGSTP
ncbi:MAG TPA: uroporphyrinogen-III C-methyltransferase [Pirellulaceae bacterium]|nr:uroporphyrinogen-III C-methyltransferase [Pirellulaceae bacterium]